MPAAGAILADLGADVIKIEPPSGDPQRGLQNALRPDDPTAANPFVEIPNRGKRSITLDLSSAGRPGDRARPRPYRRRVPHELPRAGAPQARHRRRGRASGERPDRVRARQRLGSSWAPRRSRWLRPRRRVGDVLDGHAHDPRRRRADVAATGLLRPARIQHHRGCHRHGVVRIARRRASRPWSTSRSSTSGCGR